LIDPLDEPKHGVVVDPDTADPQEAGCISGDFRQPMAQRLGQGLPRLRLHPHVNDQQGDGDGQDAVAKCLQTAASPRSAAPLHHRAMPLLVTCS
jgi:hypothetical protein